MSQKFYSLQRISEGKSLFISKDEMDVLTDNPEDALRFFSENHVEVWKKCNPIFTDATMVEMLLDDDGTVIEITRVKEKIILAFQDNHKDLLKSKKYDDYEDEKFCEGYESAMTYVLSLLGIDSDKIFIS